MAQSEFSSDTTILENLRWATLSCIDAQGKPYAVPLNVIYCKEENCLFFHCGTTGRKVSALDKNPQVCLTTVLDETLVPEKFSTHYTCVLVEGQAKRVSDATQARKALVYLTEALAPGELKHHPGVLKQKEGAYLIYKIDIDSICCKKHF